MPYKIFLFITIVLDILAVFFNNYIIPELRWSWLWVAFTAYLWGCIYYAIIRKQNLGLASLIIALGSAAFCMLIDYTVGTSFSLSWAMPIAFGAAQLTVAVAVFVFPNRMLDHLIYLVFLIILGAVPAILYAAGIFDFPYPSYGLLLITVIIVLALLVFKFKKIKSEIKKRLHF